MKIKIVILVVFALLVFSEYGLTFEEQNRGEEVQMIKIGNKLCPVSGEEIGNMGPAAEYEYNGKMYTFCCVGCINMFKVDPEKYVKIVNGRMPEKDSIESIELNDMVGGQSDQVSEKVNVMPGEIEKLLQEDLSMREYEVFGMDCPGCHQGLEKLIKKIPSVQEAEANWKKKRLIVTIRHGEDLNDEDIHDAVKRANFTVGKRIK